MSILIPRTTRTVRLPLSALLSPLMAALLVPALVSPPSPCCRQVLPPVTMRSPRRARVVTPSGRFD